MLISCGATSTRAYDQKYSVGTTNFERQGDLMESADQGNIQGQSSSQQGIGQPRVPLGALRHAVGVVAYAFGTENQCANAAALLCEVGLHLGYTLTARPVSLIAADSTGRFAVMGPKALERHPKTSAGSSLGHVVVTCENPSLLMDANLSQLEQHGMSGPIVMARIESTDPDDGEWGFQEDDLSFWYILDEGARPLIEGFDEAMAYYTAEALPIAKWIIDGATAGDILRRLGRTSGYLAEN